MTPENLTKLTFDLLTVPLLMIALALVTWFGIPWANDDQEKMVTETDTQPDQEPADWAEEDEGWALVYGRWW
ncbi:MAG: hypothetical protein KJZ93_07820 [Caldilineaceae bacterium]|nr:hypothetical protein [Caldilineaceae bacterium]